MKCMWLSSKHATFIVYINKKGFIIDGAPIAYKFIGKHISYVKRYYKVNMAVELKGGKYEKGD